MIADGNDFGTSVRLRLVVVPGAAGLDTFTASVTDYDTGAPVAASAACRCASRPLALTSGARDSISSQTSPGVFSATGTNLSLEGMWNITAVVANGATSVEVPLMLTTVSAAASPPAPSPTVDVNAVPGLPTIYTVHLSAGRTVQVYLDPGTAGPNELHATFFDASGTELPVTSVMMSLGPVGDEASHLAPRELETGHFVADAKLLPGTYTLSISAPAPGGDQLTTSLDIPVLP